MHKNNLSPSIRWLVRVMAILLLLGGLGMTLYVIADDSPLATDQLRETAAWDRMASAGLALATSAVLLATRLRASATVATALIAYGFAVLSVEASQTRWDGQLEPPYGVLLGITVVALALSLTASLDLDVSDIPTATKGAIAHAGALLAIVGSYFLTWYEPRVPSVEAVGPRDLSLWFGWLVVTVLAGLAAAARGTWPAPAVAAAAGVLGYLHAMRSIATDAAAIAAWPGNGGFSLEQGYTTGTGPAVFGLAAFLLIGAASASWLKRWQGSDSAPRDEEE